MTQIDTGHYQAFSRTPSPSAAQPNRVVVDGALLLAGRAECPTCGAHVRSVTQLGTRSVVGDLFEGWCGVCCNSVYFLPRV
jgi:hypothetical protein